MAGSCAPWQNRRMPERFSRPRIQPQSVPDAVIRICRSLPRGDGQSGSGFARRFDASRTAPDRTRGRAPGAQSRRGVDQRREIRGVMELKRPQLPLHSGTTGHRQDLHGRTGMLRCCAPASASASPPTRTRQSTSCLEVENMQKRPVSGSAVRRKATRTIRDRIRQPEIRHF